MSLSSKHQNAFTLIEMLVATVLSAVLMFALLTMLGGVSRDRKTLRALTTSQTDTGLLNLLRWDLINANSITSAADQQSLILTGVGSIENTSRSPDGRFVQVSYEIRSNNLWRTQEYLDSPSRNQNWRELVATGVSAISVGHSSRSLRVRVSTSNGVIDQTVWIK